MSNSSIAFNPTGDEPRSRLFGTSDRVHAVGQPVKDIADCGEADSIYSKSNSGPRASVVEDDQHRGLRHQLGLPPANDSSSCLLIERAELMRETRPPYS